MIFHLELERTVMWPTTEELVFTQAEHDHPAIAQIQCPVLAFFGTADVGGGAELETIRKNARNTARVDTQVLEGADHVYTDREREAAMLIAKWIATLL
jgi:dienelactone hydrolase